MPVQPTPCKELTQDSHPPAPSRLHLPAPAPGRLIDMNDTISLPWWTFSWSCRWRRSSLLVLQSPTPVGVSPGTTPSSVNSCPAPPRWGRSRAALLLQAPGSCSSCVFSCPHPGEQFIDENLLGLYRRLLPRTLTTLFKRKMSNVYLGELGKGYQNLKKDNILNPKSLVWCGREHTCCSVIFSNTQ